MMVVYCVTVYVKNAFIDQFIEASKVNHTGTRKEPGNIRFDVLQSQENPGRFFLYEVYESEEAVAEHKKTGHYNTWRSTVADWMEKPREGIVHRVVCPEDKSAWKSLLS